MIKRRKREHQEEFARTFSGGGDDHEGSFRARKMLNEEWIDTLEQSLICFKTKQPGLSSSICLDVMWIQMQHMEFVSFGLYNTVHKKLMIIEKL